MYAPHDLAQVRRFQDELRRNAEQERLATLSRRRDDRKARRTRRIFGLRLSLA